MQDDVNEEVKFPRNLLTKHNLKYFMDSLHQT